MHTKGNKVRKHKIMIHRKQKKPVSVPRKKTCAVVGHIFKYHMRKPFLFLLFKTRDSREKTKYSDLEAMRMCVHAYVCACMCV